MLYNQICGYYQLLHGTHTDLIIDITAPNSVQVPIQPFNPNQLYGISIYYLLCNGGGDETDFYWKFARVSSNFDNQVENSQCTVKLGI